MFNIIIRRAVVATAGAAIGLALFAAPAAADPRADGGEGRGRSSTNEHSTDSTSNSNYGGKDTCPAEEDPSRSDTGHGANQGGTYDDTCEAEHEPGNGSETGKATGQPCAGCVGNADDRNPKGQNPDWSGRQPEGGKDHNNGYECDGNQGIGQENPAHTSCSNSEVIAPDDNDGGGNQGGGNQGGGNQGGDGGNPGNDDNGGRDDDARDGEVGGDNNVKPKCGEAPMTTDVNGDGTVDARDCSPPTTAVLCGEVMATDVNGDGTIDAKDCTKVLGVVFEKPAAPKAEPAAVQAVAGPRKPGAQVLGVQFENLPAALSRTGATFAPLVLAALVLILTGIGMVHGRRRSINR